MKASRAMVEKLGEKEVFLVSSGDLRETANKKCWPAQQLMEQQVADAMRKLGYTIVRAHPYDDSRQHGFISSQREGLDVFRDKIHPESPIIVAEAVWQYSYHVTSGLLTHKGPILTLCNFSGQWPGLVGMLNLNASLTLLNVPYATLWSVDFTDRTFVDKMSEWLTSGKITHDTSHVRPFSINSKLEAHQLGSSLAEQFRHNRAILGIFDQGCMGMQNGVFPDVLLNQLSIFKELLSQSALLFEMSQVTDEEVDSTKKWLVDRGFTFNIGTDPATELTMEQVDSQLRMYHAAARIAHNYGCAAIGIQYQQGLKDMCPASDLAEGLLNNNDRPPIYVRASEPPIEILPGEPVVHFNEVDQGAGIDALFTNLVWSALGMNPSTTLHDIRWGDEYQGQFVWVFEISGNVPASHLIGGYAGARSERQPPMYFPLGGGTLSGVSKPGSVVWSRCFVQDDRIVCDMGRATALELPEKETRRRLESTTHQWPIMHAVLHGVSRDQLMAKHKSNHINVVYADDEASADHALQVKAAMLNTLGVKVNLCGI